MRPYASFSRSLSLVLRTFPGDPPKKATSLFFLETGLGSPRSVSLKRRRFYLLPPYNLRFEGSIACSPFIRARFQSAGNYPVSIFFLSLPPRTNYMAPIPSYNELPRYLNRQYHSPPLSHFSPFSLFSFIGHG